jgi:hypothetical protein
MRKTTNQMLGMQIRSHEQGLSSQRIQNEDHAQQPRGHNHRGHGQKHSRIYAALKD